MERLLFQVALAMISGHQLGKCARLMSWGLLCPGIMNDSVNGWDNLWETMGFIRKCRVSCTLLLVSILDEKSKLDFVN